jgi:hypothetical protein
MRTHGFLLATVATSDAYALYALATKRARVAANDYSHAPDDSSHRKAHTMTGIYTTEEAAASLGVSLKAIYQAQRRGHLPRNRHPKPPTPWTLWVFTDDDLLRYRREHRKRHGRMPITIRDAA